MLNKIETKTSYYIDGRVKAIYKYYLENSPKQFSSIIYHCDNGPAITEFYPCGRLKSKGYFVNGVIHRIDGPANIFYSEDGYVQNWYYLLGELISEKDFNTPGFVDAFILEHS